MGRHGDEEIDEMVRHFYSEGEKARDGQVDLDLPKGEHDVKEGLMKAAGAWADFEGLEDIVEDIYRQRERSFDERTVDFGFP
jgi:hypothetical protein